MASDRSDVAIRRSHCEAQSAVAIKQPEFKEIVIASKRRDSSLCSEQALQSHIERDCHSASRLAMTSSDCHALRARNDIVKVLTAFLLREKN